MLKKTKKALILIAISILAIGLGIFLYVLNYYYSVTFVYGDDPIGYYGLTSIIILVIGAILLIFALTRKPINSDKSSK